MIAGGQGYSVTELALLPPLPVHASGVAPLDTLTGGGLTPGAVWTLAGPPSIGITSLASSIAVTASRTARVAVGNEHLPTHLLRDRLRAAGDRIEIASWVPLPDYRSDDSSWFGAAYDVLIIDCYDEMFRPAAWPKGDTAIRQGRWLRELARRTNTALVLTARAERARSDGRRAFERAWHGHCGPTGLRRCRRSAGGTLAGEDRGRAIPCHGSRLWPGLRCPIPSGYEVQ